jgi:hypothetical protein
MIRANQIQQPATDPERTNTLQRAAETWILEEEHADHTLSMSRTLVGILVNHLRSLQWTAGIVDTCHQYTHLLPCRQGTCALDAYQPQATSEQERG